jgi:alpha 1,3-glucosidase
MTGLFSPPRRAYLDNASLLFPGKENPSSPRGSLVLKPTIGPHRHYSEPCHLYNLDVFEYELDEPMALYGSLPFLVAVTEESSTVGVFYFNSTEPFVDVSYDLTNDNDKGTSTH